MEEIEQFIIRLKEKRLSVRTIEDYYAVLKKLFVYHQAIGKDLMDLHRNDLREYIVFLTQTNNSISTNHHIVVIRSFYSWLMDWSGLKNNPCINLDYLKEEERLPVFLVRHELQRLYELIDEDNFITTQDVTMLDVMVGTGIRTTELCNLKAGDYFEHDGFGFFRLRVTKGDNEREVVMPEYTRDSVLRFINAMKLRAYTEEWIFPNSKGKQLTRQAAYQRISRMLVKVLSRKKGGHTLRHTFATLAIMRDVPLKAIQKQLGHQDPNTTTKYTHLDITKMKAIYEAAHPKG
jgi:site-specific recombinase XerD